MFTGQQEMLLNWV